MPYVQRNINGKVTGRYACLQPSIAEEWLDPGHVDLEKTPEELAAEAQLAADAAEQDAAKLSPVVQYLVTHTNAEIRQYVRDEVNADGVTNLATAQAALKKIETLLGHLAVAVAVNARKTLR